MQQSRRARDCNEGVDYESKDSEMKESAVTGRWTRTRGIIIGFYRRPHDELFVGASEVYESVAFAVTWSTKVQLARGSLLVLL